MSAARFALVVSVVVTIAAVATAGSVAATVETSISYQGYVTDAGGTPLAGDHQFVFQLWDDAVAGSQQGTDIGPSIVPVTDGVFTAALPVDESLFDGRGLWLRMAVDGQWLAPRQPLQPVPYALGLRPGATIAGDQSDATLSVTNASIAGAALVAHADMVGVDALGQTAIVATGRGVGVEARGMTGILAEGDVGVNARGLVGVRATSDLGRAVEGTSGSSDGLYGVSTAGHGVHGRSQMESGVYGASSGGFAAGVEGHGATGVFGTGALVGVSGYTTSDGTTGVLGTGGGNNSKGVAGVANGYAGTGVSGEAQFGVGVKGEGEIGVQGKGTVSAGVSGEGVVGVTGTGSAAGVSGSSTTGVGVWATGSGVWAQSAALRAENTSTTQGVAAYFTNQSSFANTHLYNAGSGEILVLQSSGGRFLAAMDGTWNTKFRMEYNGNAFADGSWSSGGADFAEMLPAVEGVVPGDVLAIDANGLLRPSAGAFSTQVAGVHSSKPGFVGGRPPEGDPEGSVPLAVVGVVPVKASAENGPIVPGDLLVTATRVGHAMRSGDDPPPGTVIGKALEGLETGFGLIRMLASLQ